MSRWQPIKSAPKDRRLLLFGLMCQHEGLRIDGPEVFTGYWDNIDSAWCGSGSTVEGPFYVPTHWRPLPDPPRRTAP